MKNFFYGGLVFTGYSLFQILGFVSKAYPSARLGAILLIILGLAIIGIMGFVQWCNMCHRNRGFTDTIQTILAFAPTIAFSILAILAVIVGIYAAT